MFEEKICDKKYQLLGDMKYHHVWASKMFPVAHFITYGTNFPQSSKPNTNNSQGNHYTMQLMLFIDNLTIATSHTGSVLDLLLTKSFRFKFSKFMPIVSLIFACLWL